MSSASAANFNHGQSGPPAPLTPANYADKLAKAYYEASGGSPADYFLSELTTYRRFSVIAGCLEVQEDYFMSIDSLGGVIGRCVKYEPVSACVNGAGPVGVVLSELTFLPDDGQGQRGMVTVVDLHEGNCMTYQQSRSDLQKLDRYLWGPFVPPAYDKKFKEKSDILMYALQNPREPWVRDEMRTNWHRREQFDMILAAAATALGVEGVKPPGNPQAMPDFIVPPYLLPSAHPSN